MSKATEFSNDLAQAVATGGAATVLVDARRRFPASGIAFAADLVLTADHVVTREDKLAVGTADGKMVSAVLAGRDPGSDLALLRLTDKILAPAALAASPARAGQLVLALGRPSSNGVQASWGIVVAIGGPTRTGRGGLLDQYIQTETTPYPGFSGGPLVDTEGQVIGLNTSGLTPGSALTIPANMAWRVGEALAQFGAVSRGYLGLRTQIVELTESTRQGLKLSQEQGLLVTWLEPDGPAQRGGMLVGDILTGIAGSPVNDPDDIFVSLTSETIGKSVPIAIVRGGKKESLNVTVGKRN
jgi:S1-C subfamily serine protease